MNSMFFDRYGKEYFSEESEPASKKGYFAILLQDNQVLVTVPPSSELPEFPGGHKQRCENQRECMYRKLYEETGIDFMLGEGLRKFDQIVQYLDLDDRKGTFYVYDQTFTVYDASGFGLDVSRTGLAPDGSKTYWVKVEDIIQGKVKLSYMHDLAFRELFMKS